MMRGSCVAVVVVGLMLAVSVAAEPVSSVRKLKVKSVTFAVGHRVFTDFYDEVTARMNEDFQVGDTEYSARAAEFVPDFSMDMKTRKIVSMSNDPKNPAFRVFVSKNGAPDDTTWAFLDMPPHFGRHSMLAFKILKVDFENHAPLMARRDTTKSTRPARKP
jgi:hypothetical protein